MKIRIGTRGSELAMWQALLDKKLDLSVHSLKDLPTENPPGLVIAAIPEREDPADRLLVEPGSRDMDMNLSIKQGAGFLLRRPS